jgi:hypothetical protein
MLRAFLIIEHILADLRGHEMTKVRTQTGSFAYAKYQLRRSILENALETNYTTEAYEAALELFGGCAFCGVREAPRKDHLVPVVQCGDFTPRNVVPACQKCDDSKGQREYHEWMRNSNSRRSLKARGFVDEQVEERIKLIEKWQSGYRPLTEAELFGEDYARYQEMLQQMEQLCEEARQMTSRVRSRNKIPGVDEAIVSKPSKNAESSADRIRKFILDHYVAPARNIGDKTVTVRAGDVHSQMSLHSQHANVCQAMKGNKFLNLADVQIKSFKGSLAGANAYFTYQL